MATAISEATGLPIRTKAKTDAYADGWDAIFGEVPPALGEDTRPKDRVKLGVSPSTKVTELNVEDTSHE
jgi:hypothetical protein